MAIAWASAGESRRWSGEGLAGDGRRLWRRGRICGGWEPAGRLSRLFGREIEGRGVVLEMAFMRPVAKWLVLGFAAAAKADDLAAPETIGLAVAVYDFEVSFYL